MTFFFYGTLMKGLWNNGLLKGRAEFQQKASLQGKLFRFPQFEIPVVIDSRTKTDVVQGELWDITNASLILMLDRFEGGAGYSRVVRQVQAADGTIKSAFVYLYPEGEVTEKFPQILRGDFRLFLQGEV